MTVHYICLDISSKLVRFFSSHCCHFPERGKRGMGSAARGCDAGCGNRQQTGYEGFVLLAGGNDNGFNRSKLDLSCHKQNPTWHCCIPTWHHCWVNQFLDLYNQFILLEAHALVLITVESHVLCLRKQTLCLTLFTLFLLFLPLGEALLWQFLSHVETVVFLTQNTICFQKLGMEDIFLSHVSCQRSSEH